MRRYAVKELKRLASIERGAAPARAAACAVALVYPDSYFIGMSSMGFQLVYGALNALSGVRCERAFLMPRGESLTVECRRPLSDFDVVAFSLSCEQDYGNAVEIIRRAGIPPFSASRDERFPLLLGGGVCVTLNPEPLADLFDLFVLGEAEEVLEEEGPQVSNVGKVVDSWTAGVEADVGRGDWFEYFFGAGQCVEKANRHWRGVP